jgi:calcineurin-like phosphoesterase family protein
MRNYHVISDTHFFHANSLVWEHEGVKVRGDTFTSVEEMNETMVDNWNKVVKDGDYVYHLGDVQMGGTWKEFGALWGRLKGKKRLMVGNHDEVKKLASGGYFSKIEYWKYFHEFGLLLSHMPVHPMAFEPSNRFAKLGFIPTNVHGHLHDVPSPEGKYKNVSVEMIDYTPVNLEELKVSC